jgi:hypothetical protein
MGITTPGINEKCHTPFLQFFVVVWLFWTAPIVNL